jgi:hypothetical protein
MTEAEIRAEYVTQLCAELDRLQAEWDAEHEAFFQEHPEHRDNPTFAACREFMCELFDRSECEWVYVNTFRLWPAQGFVSDGRILEVMRKPDVVWVIPSFGAKGDRVYVDVTIIDGDDSW